MSPTLTKSTADDLATADSTPRRSGARRSGRSLRPGGRTLLFLGAFVVVASMLARFYAYDRLAVIPSDVDTVTVVQTPDGQDATIFDVSTLSERQTPLRQTVQVLGDTAAAERASDATGRDVAVWYFYTCTDVPTFDCGTIGGSAAGPVDIADAPLSASVERIAIDRHTAQQVDWDDSFRETNGSRTQAEAPPSGVDTKFPFGTTAKTYQVWDKTAQDTFPAEYTGKDKLYGLSVLTFAVDIPPTRTSSIDIPGSLAGSTEATVTGDQMYSATITYDVEPRTGVIIKRVVNQDSYIAVDGERAVTTTKATLVVTDDVVRQNVDDYKTLAFLLTLIHDVLPVWGTTIGLLLCLGGALLIRRRHHLLAS